MGLKKGYDIYDAVQDGLNPLTIIQECKEYYEENNKTIDVDNKRMENNKTPPKKKKSSSENIKTRVNPGEKLPFRQLGHDETKHYFLTI